jgi:hypothetical protein
MTFLGRNVISAVSRIRDAQDLTYEENVAGWADLAGVSRVE